MKELLAHDGVDVRRLPRTFTQALYDEAKKDGWFVISMKKDWKHIFASFEE